MGKTTIYGDGRRVTVKALASSTWEYGFITKIDASEGTELGQTDLGSSTPLTPVFWGVNSPKPAKYKKVATTYSVTSFGSAGSTIPNTWKKIRKAKYRSGGGSSGTGKKVYVEFNGQKYAWNMNATVYEAIGADRAGLGITDCQSTQAASRDYIWGTNGAGSKPPRASKYNSSSSSTVSSFYDASKPLPTGWVANGGGYEE